MRLSIRRMVLALVVSVFLVPSVYGLTDIGFALDSASAQDAFLGQGSFQIYGDLRVGLSDEFQVRIPLAVTFRQKSMMAESGVQIVYYPWQVGPFMSLSLFQMGFSSQCENLDNVVSLNEVIVGWTFRFGPGIIVEPGIAIRDPSGTFSDEYSSLKGTFPCYSTFRGRLLVGWYFWRFE